MQKRTIIVCGLAATYPLGGVAWDYIQYLHGFYRLGHAFRPGDDPQPLIERGWVVAQPITYEDFLPVSAAGIFQSNLGNEKSLLH